MSERHFLAVLAAQSWTAGGQRVCRRIARAARAVPATGGIAAERDAALERAGFAYQDWINALAATGEVRTRMVAVLDHLRLTHLVTTAPGLSAIGTAAILDETGDPHR